MGVGAPLSSHTPGGCTMQILAAEVEEMSFLSMYMVSTESRGPGMFYSNINTGKSVASLV